MKRIPLLFVIFHTIVTVAVFWAAIEKREANGFAPLVVFFLDVPASFLFEIAAGASDSVGSAHDYLGYYYASGACYLIFGSLWFYQVGRFVRWLAGKLKILQEDALAGDVIGNADVKANRLEATDRAGRR
jgi:hypothetical protein